jgi:hypothetical protein
MSNFVQVNSTDDLGGSGGTFSNFTSALTAGNILVAFMRLNASISGLGTITVFDDINGAGSPWSAIPGYNFDMVTGGTRGMLGYFKANTAGGGPGSNPNFHVTWTGASVCRTIIGEIASSVTSNVIDKVAIIDNTGAGATTAGATPASGTTANANDLLISIFGAGGGQPGLTAITDNVAGSNPSSGWVHEQDIGSAIQLAMASNVVSATGNYNENVTFSVANTYGSGIVAVEKAAGGGAAAIDSLGQTIYRRRNQPWAW